MKQTYEALFTPWKIGKVEIKNRIVLCPMGGTSLFGWMEPNHFDKEAANFFLERARNNVGLIIPGIAPIRDTIGGRWLYQNKKMFRELKPYMEEIHQTGAKLFVQITAGMGRSWGISDQVLPLHKNPVLRTLAKPILDTNYQLASPSPLPSRWAPEITCPQMTVPQIEEIIEAFAKTAVLCKEAGVDGVEVHAVHEGYLLDQFAMKYTNHRTDAYGGNFENRYRFAVEIVKAIKAACGADYPVSVRYSAVSKVKDFCYGALPGETWRIRIVKTGKSVCYGRGEECLSPAEGRVEPDCPVYGRCGGCACRHMSYELELEFKRQKVNDALRRIGGADIEVDGILASPLASRYRNKAIFAVGGSASEPVYGFFRAGSHDVVPVDDCPLQSELSSRCARTVCTWMRKNSVAPYVNGAGLVRHVFTFTLAEPFFRTLGFSAIARETIPPVVWAECSKCPKFYKCDEVGMMLHLDA